VIGSVFPWLVCHKHTVSSGVDSFLIRPRRVCLAGKADVSAGGLLFEKQGHPSLCVPSGHGFISDQPDCFYPFNSLN
jgi:hypothetical protein